jgi:hypothetical protein
MTQLLSLEGSQNNSRFEFGTYVNLKFTSKKHKPYSPCTNEDLESRFPPAETFGQSVLKGRRVCIPTLPKQESKSKLEESPTRPQSPATSSLPLSPPPSPTIISPLSQTHETYQLQRSTCTPPSIADIHKVQIPNKIVRNNHHVDLPSFQLDHFRFQQHSSRDGQKTVLQEVEMGT